MKKLFLAISICLIHQLSFSQQSLQSYTPSILFEAGEWEIKSFQNFYTQTKSFKDGKKEANGERSNYFTSINQVLFGVNGQFNVGFDVWVKSVAISGDNLGTRYGVSSVGPKIKVAPFKNLERLSIQSSILFPTIKRHGR